MAGNVKRLVSQTPRPRMVVEGNTVRREERSGQRRRQEEKKTLGRARLRQNRERAQKLNVPSLVAMGAAAVAVVLLCANYLQIQSGITSSQKSISQLESQLQSLRTDNSALENRISTLVDLDYIYQVATEELGMTYASDDQVIYYDKSESEYVRQYEDIPTD